MISFGCPTESYVCSVVHPLPFPLLFGTPDPARRRELRVDETVVCGVAVTVAESPAFLRGGMSSGGAGDAE